MKLFKSLKSALAAKDEATHLKLTLKGDFPQEILSLHSLRELYLDGECQEIPSLKSLSQLELISLTLNQINAGLESLMSLPRLKNLKLIGVRIEDFTLPEVSELSPLHSLTLKECALNSLPKAIGKLGLLTEMNLAGNSLSELPSEFKNLHYLKRLNLDSNAFANFPEVLSGMKSLKHLSLDGNPFSEEEKARIQRYHHLTIH